MKRFALLVLLAFAGADADAQSDSARIPGDSVIERARNLVTSGRDADGGRLIDSVLKANTPDDAIYAEALYWRGALAATAADAERDYRRLLIEAPLAPRAEDALLQLANLLQARGDRRGASEYFQRFMLTYANSAARPRVAVSLVRLLFEQGPQQQARACEALRMGREAIPEQNFELRNQLEFYAPRCSMVVADMAPPPPAPVDSSAPLPVPTDLPPSPDTAQRPSPVPTVSPPRITTPAKSFYSVQVAAYDSAEAAKRLVQLLMERGLEARVDGTVRPFRVRIGRYTTRADAVQAAATLKSQGHNGFVTLVSGR